MRKALHLCSSDFSRRRPPQSAKADFDLLSHRIPFGGMARLTEPRAPSPWGRDQALLVEDLSAQGLGLRRDDLGSGVSIDSWSLIFGW